MSAAPVAPLAAIGLRPVWNDDGHLVCWEPLPRLSVRLTGDRVAESEAGQHHAAATLADSNPVQLGGGEW